MVAVAVPTTHDRGPYVAPTLRLVGPPPVRRRNFSPSVYRRRRVLVVVVVLGVLLALRLLLGALGGGPLPASERGVVPMQPIAGEVHVVQPGDTLWTIARSLQPEGDVRPLVDRLSRQRGNDPLVPGERIHLDAVR